MTKRLGPDIEMAPKPVDGPLTEEAYFAIRPPVPGARPCRRLGLGTAWLGRLYETPEEHAGIETLHAAWRAGFALVDSAPGYGPAEPLLGKALAAWDGDRPVVATKTAQRNPDMTAVVEQYERSVERLGRIDLLAVHDADPGFPADSRRSITDFITRLLAKGDIDAAGLGGGGPITQAQWLDAGIYRYVITFNRLGIITLQGLEDTVPQARRAGASIFAASPMFMGLLGSRRREMLADPPEYVPPVFVERVKTAMQLAEAWDVALTHLAIRFLLSMPAVDVVLTGAANPTEWADVQAAYEAGPLPADQYTELWQLAQRGTEPMVGG